MTPPAAPPRLSPSVEPPGAQVGVLTCLSVEFLLDLIAIVRNGRDLLDALLLTTIIQANAAETRRPDLQLADPDRQNETPDDLKRPVSLNALASSLAQPYETVRRRVRRMAIEGLVEIGPAGAIVPGRLLSSSDYVLNGLQAYEHTRALYYQLSELGLIGEAPRNSPNLAIDDFPLRAMARLTSDYALRLVAAMVGAMGDLVDGLVFLETFRSNVEHLPLEAWRAQDAHGRETVADSLRRPAPVSRLATRLGLPTETVRRHVRTLQASGALERHRGGIIAPASALDRLELREALDHNIANLQRLFAGLAQVGVLALWDGMPRIFQSPENGARGQATSAPATAPTRRSRAC